MGSRAFKKALLLWYCKSKGWLNMTENRQLIEEIKRLKEQQDAVIVAHTYQNGEVQAIADMVGDSFALSKYCANLTCSTIVFCGVGFMAESAKILSPDKRVLLPEQSAGCPMADMITAEELREFRAQHPDAAVVTYINSSSAVKAESDVIVTSSNALKVVKNMPEKKILFCPDQNLGSYIAAQCPEKEFVLWQGYCPTHHAMQGQIAKAMKEKYPEAELLVHPECKPEVTAYADYIGSTQGIIDYARNSEKKEFIIGTEMGTLYPLSQENPDKIFHLMDPELVCTNMKLTTLESIRRSLETGTYEMQVPEEVAAGARKSLTRMLELASR